MLNEVNLTFYSLCEILATLHICVSVCDSVLSCRLGCMHDHGHDGAWPPVRTRAALTIYEPSQIYQLYALVWGDYIYLSSAGAQLNVFRVLSGMRLLRRRRRRRLLCTIHRNNAVLAKCKVKMWVHRTHEYDSRI